MPRSPTRGRLVVASGVSALAHAGLLWLEIDRPARTVAESPGTLAPIELVEREVPGPGYGGGDAGLAPEVVPGPVARDVARVAAGARADAGASNAAALALRGLRRDEVEGGSGPEPLAIERPLPTEPDVAEPDTTVLDRRFVEAPDGTRRFRDSGNRFKASLNRDGSVAFRDAPVAYDREQGVFVMEGAAEWIKRAGGQDPYAASKNRLLKETFDARLYMGEQARREDQEVGLSRLGRELMRMWEDRSKSAAQRRRILFERWDECEELHPDAPAGFGRDEGSGADLSRRRAGHRARREIEAFVREQLPRGSSGAFSEAELRRLNATRVSRERFDPYAGG